MAQNNQQIFPYAVKLILISCSIFPRKFQHFYSRWYEIPGAVFMLILSLSLPLSLSLSLSPGPFQALWLVNTENDVLWLVTKFSWCHQYNQTEPTHGRLLYIKKASYTDSSKDCTHEQTQYTLTETVHVAIIRRLQNVQSARLRFHWTDRSKVCAPWFSLKLLFPQLSLQARGRKQVAIFS